MSITTLPGPPLQTAAGPRAASYVCTLHVLHEWLRPTKRGTNWHYESGKSERSSWNKTVSTERNPQNSHGKFTCNVTLWGTTWFLSHSLQCCIAHRSNAHNQETTNAHGANGKGWPESCIYTVYDRIFGDFPAKSIVYTPYVHGSGQPYTWGTCSRSNAHNQDTTRKRRRCRYNKQQQH